MFPKFRKPGKTLTFFGDSKEYSADGDDNRKHVIASWERASATILACLSFTKAFSRVVSGGSGLASFFCLFRPREAPGELSSTPVTISRALCALISSTRRPTASGERRRSIESKNCWSLSCSAAEERTGRYMSMPFLLHRARLTVELVKRQSALPPLPISSSLIVFMAARSRSTCSRETLGICERSS